MTVAYVRIYRVAKQQQEQIYSLTYSVGQCIVNLDQVGVLVLNFAGIKNPEKPKPKNKHCSESSVQNETKQHNFDIKETCMP